MDLYSFKSFYENNPITFIMGLVFFVSFLLIVVKSFFKRLKRRLKINKYKNYDFSKIDYMDGIEFENLIDAKFQKMGYTTKLTKATKDYGVDLIAIKNKRSIAIQIKRYNRNVGVKAIQEVIAAKAFYKTDTAMVLTNSYFTKPAKNLAKETNVILIDRSKLAKIL
ncbi:restriction endonuclease [Finegoldia magna]|uniref:restriction endonuclease n=1 Tax=Finegoldia magna TaxID=1260 RepID=UPI00292DC596|nr:restriction endonuclease [Finegoldia magna]